MSVVVFKTSSLLSVALPNHAPTSYPSSNGPLKSPTGEIGMGGIDYVSKLAEAFLYGGTEMTDIWIRFHRAARAASSSGIG